jgi:hypothetical protein
MLLLVLVLLLPPLPLYQRLLKTLVPPLPLPNVSSRLNNPFFPSLLMHKRNLFFPRIKNELILLLLYADGSGRSSGA